MEIYSIIIGYLLLFMCGGVGGWFLEFFFRRIVHKKWVNPGFLNGPLLPLYGFGVVILYAISDINIDWWWKILLFFVTLTLVEYIAGIIFIKGMGLKLWDYSKMWGNIQGIICPLFSVAWAIIGAAFLFLCYPMFNTIFEWIDNNLFLSFFLGVPYGIFFVDLCISFHVSMRLREVAKRANSILPFEQVKEYVMDINKKAKTKLRFALPFKTTNLSESVEQFISELKEKASRLIKKPEDENEKDSKEGD